MAKAKKKAARKAAKKTVTTRKAAAAPRRKTAAKPAAARKAASKKTASRKAAPRKTTSRKTVRGAAAKRAVGRAAPRRAADDVRLGVSHDLDARLRALALALGKSLEDVLIQALSEFADAWEDHLDTVNALGDGDDRVQLALAAEDDPADR